MLWVCEKNPSKCPSYVLKNTEEKMIEQLTKRLGNLQHLRGLIPDEYILGWELGSTYTYGWESSDTATSAMVNDVRGRV